MELFRAQGAGHLVLISSVAECPRHAPAPGRRTARARPRSTRWPRASAPTSTARGSPSSTILPGYIATDINVGRRGPFTVAARQGRRALTDVIEREPVRGYVPEWPWRRSPGCCAGPSPPEGSAVRRPSPAPAGQRSVPKSRHRGRAAAVRMVVRRRRGRPRPAGPQCPEDGEQLLALGADVGRVDDRAVTGHDRSPGERVQPAERRGPVGRVGVLERRRERPPRPGRRRTRRSRRRPSPPRPPGRGRCARGRGSAAPPRARRCPVRRRRRPMVGRIERGRRHQVRRAAVARSAQPGDDDGALHLPGRQGPQAQPREAQIGAGRNAALPKQWS